MGRPRIDDGKDTTMGFRCHQTVKDDIKARAEHGGYSITEYIVGCCTGRIQPIDLPRRGRRIVKRGSE